MIVRVAGTAIGGQLRHGQVEIRNIVVHQVPGVGRKLVADLFDESGRPEKMETLVAPDQQPDQPVKPYEMIHMGM